MVGLQWKGGTDALQSVQDFPNIPYKNSRYHAKCVEAQKAKEVLKTKHLVN